MNDFINLIIPHHQKMFCFTNKYMILLLQILDIFAYFLKFSLKLIKTKPCSVLYNLLLCNPYLNNLFPHQNIN